MTLSIFIKAANILRDFLIEKPLIYIDQLRLRFYPNASNQKYFLAI